MTDSRLARRQDAPAPRPYGALPSAQTDLSVERALELAGVDATEFALLASTTFKQARSLEELVTLIAATRRRGLDGMLNHVYFEKFGGESAGPSLHTGINGLRAIAAATGQYGGGAEPSFSGVWDMPLEDGKTKQVPEKCRVTVWRIVKDRSCAFEGVAFMEEAYPGTSGRGRMWRQRPRGMLAVAAERQALRRAFPSETSGIGDIDEGEEPSPPPPPTQTAAMHKRIFDGEEQPQPVRRRERPLGELVDYYVERLESALEQRLIDEAHLGDWQLPRGADRETVIDFGTRLTELFDDRPAPPEITVHDDRDLALESNARLLSEAAELRVPGLKSLKADPRWNVDHVEAVNDELRNRIRERQGELDTQLAGQVELPA